MQGERESDRRGIKYQSRPKTQRKEKDIIDIITVQEEQFLAMHRQFQDDFEQ